MPFIHLHNHTHYSLLDGLTKIDELIATAKEDGANAVAISDHGNMYGVIEFYQKCKKAGIKPIVGVEMYMAEKSRLNKVSKSDERNYHLLLLAKNETGYKNLIKLTSIAHMEGYYYKPRIDWEVLREHSEGLIACTACIAGEIPKLILAGKEDQAKKRALEFKELFGAGNYYLEIQPHDNFPEQEKVNAKLIELSKELDIPIVATNDMHYLKPEDYDVQDVLLCLQTKKKKTDIDRMNMHGSDYYYKPGKAVRDYFRDFPEAVENTQKIADACNLEIKLGEIHLPFFPVPEGCTEMSYLRQLCEQGLVKRYGQNYSEVSTERRERMDYELSVIEKMGWPSYFLIVSDFINWAKDNGIMVGPGRGSAAGSLVCYLTGITNLDPLPYDLLFERFLNPDRVSMPDIDTDFSDLRRDEVIRYVEEKYGQNHVSQIITFGTMAARAAIRDVGRVLGVAYDFCDQLAKMIPMFTKLDEALGTVPELKDIYGKDPNARKVIDYARRLEGVARHASTHACGVLITKNPLTDYVPIQYASSSDRTIVSQYSLHPVEDLGLLKMDFLGLKNLTILESAVKIIKNVRGLSLDMDKIPLDDAATFQLFQRGETTGVFQFESSGMKRYLKELKPSHFEDIIAIVALYRPGPMEWIPDYIASKHGRKKVAYLHPKLEPILAKTYGVAIYQEQVMQIARSLAGFTMGEADVLRKAMGKKIAELLAKQKEKFISGCVQNLISKELAEKIFSFIEPFAGYGFNRSHAACYALIGYQTAYLKSHWPAEFMAALLMADQGNTDRIAIEIEECRAMGISVLPPDVNESFDYFTVVNPHAGSGRMLSDGEKVDTIRFGLKAIKNVGDHIAELIIQERKNNGRFEDLGDFLSRILDKDLNKKSLESLAKSGSFDQFHERRQILENMEMMLTFNKEVSKQKNSPQASLFGSLPSVSQTLTLKLEETAPASRQEKLAWERELMGLYITEHPFIDFKKHLIDLIVPLNQLESHINADNIRAAGIITSIKKILTKSNESMIFAKIEDDSGSAEILVFPRLLKETPSIWIEGNVVMVQGKISNKDKEVKLLANIAEQLFEDTFPAHIEKLKKKFKANYGSGGFPSSAPRMNYPQRIQPFAKNEQRLAAISQNIIVLKIEKTIEPRHFAYLKEFLVKHKGESKVIFSIPNGGNKPNIIETEHCVAVNGNFQEELSSQFGGQVVVMDSQMM